MGIKQPSVRADTAGKKEGVEPFLYRVRDVSILTNLSKSLIYELVASGDLPAIRIGKAIRVPAASLRAWLDAKVEEAGEKF